ncbi:MAG: hydroxylamine reductase [Clostridiales bacterium GWF2_38_85]|nr:MAG: hydroxylamine reductase [Clostridiales bacterium GWF2_38_85]
MSEMFCFQCEQTAGCKACTGTKGVCGKNEDTAVLQDELVGSLISLARTAVEGKQEINVYKDIIIALFATVTNVNFDSFSISDRINRIHNLQEKLGCQFPDQEMEEIWDAGEDIRSLKSLILFGLKGMAAYAFHAMKLGYTDNEVNHFFCTALSAIGEMNRASELLPVVLEVGRVNLKCMELLDRANTETYGNPVPTKVTLNIEKGPFIVVSGHDLQDLYLLLEQTKDKGINIYTHGEMLPAHAYPRLKAYQHFKGNFGTAWQNQQKEFENIPAPVLFTTNCIMPVKENYRDRIFTTDVVEYPGTRHIGQNKDFSQIIKKALELGGYPNGRNMYGINGGFEVTVGFGHHTVLSVADMAVNAMKSGSIRHIFLVGGCDGAKPGRNYYTDFVKNTPKNTIILTLACGKYRFNDMQLGEINGIPRLMDIGQCNDAYSAIKVAVELSKAMECEVNELPLSMVLSWYEQKAVCILLTLFYLGIKNIYLGPTLPAFISPNILKYLVEKYNISPISTAEADLKKILG